jgi:hypothetical protein
MPTIVTMAQTEPTGRLAEVAATIREYHEALDRREHGDVACHRAVQRIEKILGLKWRALIAT